MSDTEVTVPEQDEAVQESPIASAVEAKEKRYRATKTEMEKREAAAIRLMQQSPVTINKICTETSLSYPKASALVQKLVQEGRVTVIGSDGNRTLYKLDPKVSVKPVRQLPDVSFANFLDHFHIGQTIKVVGMHVTNEGQQLDVEVDEEIIKLQTV